MHDPSKQSKNVGIISSTGKESIKDAGWPLNLKWSVQELLKDEEKKSIFGLSF